MPLVLASEFTSFLIPDISGGWGLRTRRCLLFLKLEDDYYEYKKKTEKRLRLIYI